MRERRTPLLTLQLTRQRCYFGKVPSFRYLQSAVDELGLCQNDIQLAAARVVNAGGSPSRNFWLYCDNIFASTLCHVRLFNVCIFYLTFARNLPLLKLFCLVIYCHNMFNTRVTELHLYYFYSIKLSLSTLKYH